jgi:peptide deformylase
MKLVAENDPILTQTCQNYDFDNPPFDNAQQFAIDLYNTMVKNDGLGLSACQVGYPYRVFAMRTNSENPLVLFNPRIVDVSDKMVSMKEGCLSFPLLYLNVKRPDYVRVRYQEFTGQTITDVFIGMSARVALHEYDHLEGKVFTSVASSFETQRAMRKRMILQRRVRRAA